MAPLCAHRFLRKIPPRENNSCATGKYAAARRRPFRAANHYFLERCFSTLAFPLGPAIILLLGLVAQSVEQRIENPCVGGSIPPRATKNKLLQNANPRRLAFSFVETEMATFASSAMIAAAGSKALHWAA
jgi:hypothetical protein